LTFTNSISVEDDLSWIAAICTFKCFSCSSHAVAESV
jgi:hypothetical protein